MKKKNLKSITDVERYYRTREKEIMNKINPKKKIIFWSNAKDSFQIDRSDVLNWWGYIRNTGRLSGVKNTVIMSTNDQTYLDKGFGDRDLLNSYKHMVTWREVYAFNPNIKGANILGG